MHEGPQMYPKFAVCCTGARAPSAGGAGGMPSPGLAKNAMENAVLLEWCMPLETPMFRLVLHDRALKAWTV